MSPYPQESNEEVSPEPLSQSDFEAALARLLSTTEEEQSSSDCDVECPCEDDSSYQCDCPEVLKCSGCSSCGRPDPVNLATGEAESCPTPEPPYLSGSYCDCNVSVVMEPHNPDGPVYVFAFRDCASYSACCPGTSLGGGKCSNWVFSDGHGNTLTFDQESGELLSRSDASGRTTRFIGSLSGAFNDSDNQPVEMVTTWQSNGQTFTQSERIGYVADPGNANAGSALRRSITRRRKVDDQDWQEQSRTEFEYYQSDVDGKGLAGQLKFEHQQTKRDGQWQPRRSKYYRYYTEDDANGQSGAIKLIVHEDNLAQIADAESATDAQLAGYAYVYYKYNQVRWIATRSGAIEKTIEYTLNPNVDVLNDTGNHWKRKAVMTCQADNSVLTVFSNSREQDLLKHEAGPGVDKVTAYRFDERGKQVAVYHPSVFDLDAGLYDESQSNLASILNLAANKSAVKHGPAQNEQLP